MKIRVNCLKYTNIYFNHIEFKNNFFNVEYNILSAGYVAIFIITIYLPFLIFTKK